MLNFNYSQFLLEVDVNQPIADVGEKLAYGGKMMLVGMGIVFSVIISLYICLSIFKFVCQKLTQGSDTQSKPSVVESAPAVVPAPVSQVSQDEEIVAVIAAAIAAASSEMPDKKFRVVSFKRL